MVGYELDDELADVAIAAGLPVVCEDGLSKTWAGEHILMNPPYKDAERWVLKALTEASSVTALLRLGFLASKRRQSLFLTHPLSSLAVLSSRPSFVGGRTDNSEYAWFHWSRQLPLATTLTWLSKSVDDSDSGRSA